MAARARPPPESCRVPDPRAKDRVDGGAVAVREGGGKGWHEAEKGHGAGIGGSSFVHTTVHLEKEGETGRGGRGDHSPLPALLPTPPPPPLAH